ncbi:hypothetical protein ABZ815_51080 [Nonomuraea sp. NPDC047529]|uniref:hypothetical protein n=1 Tax=Nonomuraea sp. NPDC047529 TaxID=3155623 RepID=UPI0033D2E871
MNPHLHDDDRQPSATYTIDDLPFLTLAAAAHPRMERMLILLSSQEIAEKEKTAARRLPHELISSRDVPPSLWARETAEMTLARCCHAPTLHVLAGSPFHAVRVAVARNVFTPGAVLAELARSDDGLISNTSAANPGLPLEDLEAAFLLGTVTARHGALLHPGVPQHIVDVAAEDPTWMVRCAAAAHARATPAALARLAVDQDAVVRAAAAGNPALPPHLTPMLAADSDRHVRARLAGNLACPAAAIDRLAHDPDPWVARAVAQAPALTEAAAVLLAADPTPEVRAKLAGNPACPARLLAALAHQRQPVGVRSAVAANPATPPPTVQRLAADRSRTVREAALQNAHSVVAGGE